MPDLLLAILLASALAPTPAGAAPTIYKCAGAGDSVVYQDTPCAAGKELRNFTKDPPTVSVIPGTPLPGKAAPAAASPPRAERIATAKRAKAESNAGERRFIAVGMTAAEVIQRIGKPDVNANNQRGKGQHWSYLPKDGDPDTTTTLTLVGGKVAGVERKVVR
jgi:hypothetical protein